MSIENETQPTPEAPPTDTATPDQAPATKPEGQEGEDNKDRPRPNGFQKRIDRLTREKYELLGRLKALEERAAPRQQEGSEEPESDEDPKQTIRREAEKVAQDLLRQQEMKRTKEEHAKSWRAQEAEAKKRLADYDDVVPEFVESDIVTPQMEAAILECDKPVDVTYYLAKHPEEAEAIAQMSPVRQVAAIGKIEARLDTTQPNLKKQSAAPAPIAPVKPKGKPDDGPRDDQSIEDWLKNRNAQIRSR